MSYSWVLHRSQKWWEGTEITGSASCRQLNHTALGLWVGVWGGDGGTGWRPRRWVTWRESEARCLMYLIRVYSILTSGSLLYALKKSYYLLLWLLTLYIHVSLSFLIYLFILNVCVCVFIFLGWDNMSFSSSSLSETKCALCHSMKKVKAWLRKYQVERYYSIKHNFISNNSMKI